MSGHSKWSTIKRKKAAVDAKRGKVFTRLLREIQVAAKIGGSSIDGNPRLKTAVAAAKAQSVPGDNIDRAIKRGSGELEGVDYEECTYEGYGPGGVAVLVKALTENKNRTVAAIRHAFTKCNGSLASTNAVAYLFDQKGVFTINKQDATEEQIYEAALDAGIEEVSDEEDVWEVVCSPADFEAVSEALKTLGKGVEGEMRMVPSTTTRVEGNDAKNVIRLLEMLDDLDDVQSVDSNFDVDADELKELES